MKPKELHLKFIDTATDGVSIRAELTPGVKSYDIFFRSNDIELTKNTEVLLAAGLLPAMKIGSTLVANGVISQKLFNSIESISNFFHTLNPHLKKIKIKNLVPQPANPPKENRVGVFFSAGVDSFYSLLKHEDEITDLIFIHGFDISLDNYPLRKKLAKTIRKIGANFGKRVIEIETNLRSFYQHSFIQPYLLWQYGFLTTLASAGHLLFPFFRRFFIASTHTLADNYRPYSGSHPASDSLWGTEALEFIHDGCEATRVDKATLVAKSGLALNSLRVCGRNTEKTYNCGGCEKCIRTMINLHCVGALERCTTFPNKLDIKLINKIVIRYIPEFSLLQENLKALKNRPDDRELHDALYKVWRKSWWLKFPIKYPWVYRHRWLLRILRGLGNISSKFFVR
jgi:hypothetical protein